ncbi:MAG: sensor histidine kinase, partial [Acetatifactor sp.]|nr:sensor histidine kinase [Acetatifactor sp.]
MLRNREVRRLLTAFFLLGAAAAIRGFSIDCSAGVLILILSAAFIVLFWVFAKYRYDKIDRLSEQIDMVLHNSEHLLIAESEEGELSVLQSEIIKMTQRIREQNKALQREKEHL